MRRKIVSLIRIAIRPAVPIIRRIIGVPEVMLEEMPNCPGLFHSYRAMLATGHERVNGGWLYDGKFYPDYLTVGGNSFAIRNTAMKYCKGDGLDIGAGFWPFPGSVPIDTEQGPGLENAIDDIPSGTQDYVFSSHCLEHINLWEDALDQWIGKLKSGGILFLYLPHPECGLWNMSNPFMKNIHVWVPNFEIIRKTLLEKGMKLVAYDEGPDTFQSFYICSQKPSK